jgi:hypothetical protein
MQGVGHISQHTAWNGTVSHTSQRDLVIVSIHDNTHSNELTTETTLFECNAVMEVCLNHKWSLCLVVLARYISKFIIKEAIRSEIVWCPQFCSVLHDCWLFSLQRWRILGHRQDRLYLCFFHCCCLTQPPYPRSVTPPLLPHGNTDSLNDYPILYNRTVFQTYCNEEVTVLMRTSYINGE